MRRFFAWFRRASADTLSENLTEHKQHVVQSTDEFALWSQDFSAMLKSDTAFHYHLSAEGLTK